MGEIFEKLLLINDIISEEELGYYKKLQSSTPQKRHLGEILLEKGLIDHQILAQLQEAEKRTQAYGKLLKKQKKDKKVLEVVQKLGIVRQEEIANCIRERREAERRDENVFLTDLFIEKGYLTRYLIKKFYRRGVQRIKLPSGVKKHEELIVNIPKYLKDRFLGRIAITNGLLTKSQLDQCWHSLKKHWPRKALAPIMLERNFINEKKLKVLTEVMEQALPNNYPYFNSHIRDTKLAKLIVKRNFLSPWRINKCLLKQLHKIKNKEYTPLRQILIEEGYLTDYQFDVVLEKYENLVYSEDSQVPDAKTNKVEINWEQQEENASQAVDLPRLPLNLEESKTDSFPVDKVSASKLSEELDSLSSFEDDDVEYMEEEDLVSEPREPDEQLFEDIDSSMQEVLEEVTLDASEECYAEELVRDSFADKDQKKKKKKKKKKSR